MANGQRLSHVTALCLVVSCLALSVGVSSTGGQIYAYKPGIRTNDQENWQKVWFVRRSTVLCRDLVDFVVPEGNRIPLDFGI